MKEYTWTNRQSYRVSVEPYPTGSWATRLQAQIEVSHLQEGMEYRFFVESTMFKVRILEVRSDYENMYCVQ